jgi:hypothetical protein
MDCPIASTVLKSLKRADAWRVQAVVVSEVFVSECTARLTSRRQMYRCSAGESGAIISAESTMLPSTSAIMTTKAIQALRGHSNFHAPRFGGEIMLKTINPLAQRVGPLFGRPSDSPVWRRLDGPIVLTRAAIVPCRSCSVRATAGVARTLRSLPARRRRRFAGR